MLIWEDEAEEGRGQVGGQQENSRGLLRLMTVAVWQMAPAVLGTREHR